MTGLESPSMLAPEYHSGWLAGYEQLNAADTAIIAAEMAAFRRLVAPYAARARHERMNYLDLGTCTGRYLRWAAGQGFATVCGVDNSPAAVTYCYQSALPGNVHLYEADFVQPDTLVGIATEHGPFQLITAMLGTIDHAPRAAQLALLCSLREVLAPTGAVVLSGWRPGRCDLSLYSDTERRYLDAMSFTRVLYDSEAIPPGLRLADSVTTQWHLLALFTPNHGLGTR
jgi:2-polyprenyl-3-methyl-5-hydroxy-6-metoxy-1,4-benzoquinol methylase